MSPEISLDDTLDIYTKENTKRDNHSKNFSHFYRHLNYDYDHSWGYIKNFISWGELNSLGKWWDFCEKERDGENFNQHNTENLKYKKRSKSSRKLEKRTVVNSTFFDKFDEYCQLNNIESNNPKKLKIPYEELLDILSKTAFRKSYKYNYNKNQMTITYHMKIISEIQKMSDGEDVIIPFVNNDIHTIYKLEFFSKKDVNKRTLPGTNYNSVKFTDDRVKQKINKNLRTYKSSRRWVEYLKNNI